MLVKQKRLAKTALIPCVVRTSGMPEEDSLAENVQRAPLHPLDQFRAFKTFRDKGLGDEEIAARFFVAPVVVKQRLRLAAVSEKLLEVYARDEMTLEQLMNWFMSAPRLLTPVICGSATLSTRSTKSAPMRTGLSNVCAGRGSWLPAALVVNEDEAGGACKSRTLRAISCTARVTDSRLAASLRTKARHRNGKPAG